MRLHFLRKLRYTDLKIGRSGKIIIGCLIQSWSCIRGKNVWDFCIRSHLSCRNCYIIGQLKCHQMLYILFPIFRSEFFLKFVKPMAVSESVIYENSFFCNLNMIRLSLFGGFKNNLSVLQGLKAEKKFRKWCFYFIFKGTIKHKT